MIIGLTGSYGSGKDTVAKILQEMNFFLISLSDFLREELKSKKVTKENFTDITCYFNQRLGELRE